MEFWFCEKCGVRVAEAELTKGATRNPDSGVVFCVKCSTAVAPPPVVHATPKVRTTPATGNSVPAQASSVRMVPARGVSARTRETTILRAPSSSKRDTMPARPERGQERVDRAPESAMKKNMPLLIGVGSAVVLIAGAAVFSMTGSPPKDKIADVTPKTSGGESSQRNDPTPAPVHTPAPQAPPLAQAKDDSAKEESAAQDAFASLERKVKSLSELSSQNEAIDEYLEKYGKSIVAARARTLKSKLKEDAQPKKTTPPVKQVVVEDPSSVIARAQEILSKQDIAGAIAIYDKAIAADKTVYQYYQNRANMRLLAGDFDGVRADADKALSMQPEWASYAMKAIAAFAEKHDDDFRTNLEKAASMNNITATELAQKLAGDLQRSRWVAEGKAFETKAPSTGIEYILRGHFKLARGKVDDGISDLREGIKRDETLGPKGIFVELADLARGQKDFKAVLGYFKQWSEVKPETAVALNSYAWELLTTQDTSLRDAKTALPLAERAAELTQKNDAAILDTLALAYFNNNRVKAAITTEQKAIELLPAGTTAAARQDYEKHLADFQAMEGKDAPETH